MSKLVVVLCGVLLVLAGVSFAQEPVDGYGMTDPYSGPTPSGMRFGEIGRAVSMQTGDIEEGYAGGGNGGPGCPGCQFGVPAPPCDPAWGGPCLDWKLVGWYSSFHDKNHGGWGCNSCRAGCRGGSCDSCSSY